MTRLRAVGFYREMEIATGGEPSIHRDVGTIDPAIKPRALSYLRAGAVLLAYFTLSEDVLDEGRAVLGPLEIRTDGEWVWRSDLAHYVERYDLGLQPEFVEHMASRSWQPPAAESIDVETVTVKAGFHSDTDQEEMRHDR